MLKVQIALIAILIVSVAFVSCERAQQMLDPVADDMMAADMMATDDMMKMIMDMMDSTMYMSWAHVALPAPTMTVAEAAAALNAAGTGAAHGEGTRTAYINDIGAMANKAGTAYPAGTVIVKTIMDDANTFVAKKAVMTKTDDPMYADHNGWMYVKYARASEVDEYMMVGGGSLEKSMGCHGCHAKASNDSVFISLPMDDMDDMMAADDMTDMMADMMDSTMYMSWASVELPAPTMTVAEAAAALNAAGTGAAHGEGTRTAYINDIGAMANKVGTAYPAGTMIVKTIMDDANTFVAKKAVMTKTDDPMYADHNGWMYVKYARASEADEYMMVGGGSLEKSMGCHGCHAKASNDSVFVSLSMDDMMDETTMEDMEDDMDNMEGMDGTNMADVNGDGVVNNLDLAAVRDQIGQPVTADNMNADVDDDGDISHSDLAAVVGSQLGQPVTADNMDFDVNGDGDINHIDIVIVLGLFPE